MASKPKYPTSVTPPGIAAYAWLSKPDTKFQKHQNDTGDYKLTVIIDDTQENRDYLDGVEKTARAFAPTMEPPIKMKKVLTHVPWDLPEDDDLEDPKLKEEFKGKIRIAAKSSFKPGLIDTSKPKPKELPENVFIMSGDRVRMKFQIKPFDGLGGGISAKLRTVQLIEKLNMGGGIDASGFDDIEGYVVDSDGDDEEEGEF